MPKTLLNKKEAIRLWKRINVVFIERRNYNFFNLGELTISAFINDLFADLNKAVENKKGNNACPIDSIRKIIKYTKGEVKTLQLTDRVLNNLALYVGTKDYQFFLREEKLKAIENKKELFYSTKWFLYYFEEDDVSKERGVAQAILTIDEEGEVEIENIEKVNGADYQGSFEIVDKQYLFMNLFTKRVSEKRLHIRLFIGVGMSYPIYMGLYTNITGRGSINAGTLLLESIKDKNKNIAPVWHKPKGQEIEGLDIDVIRFFSNKNLNQLKIPNDILTKKELKSWLDKKEDERAIRKKRLMTKKDFKYDVFVSSPMASVPEGEYETMREATLAVINALKEHCGFSSFYYAGRNIETTDDFEANDLSLEIDLEALNDSKIFLMIYPEPLVSSVLVEAGWALQSKKPSFYCVKTKKNLPFLLENAEGARKDVNVRIVEYDGSIDHLVKTLVEYRSILFDSL